MKSTQSFLKKVKLITMMGALFVFTIDGFAQHRGGGARRSAPSRPAASHSRPAASHSVSRPAASHTTSRPAASQ